MRSMSRKKIWLLVLGTAAVSVVAGLFLLDDGFAKLFTVLSILVVSAVLLATNLDKSGPLSIILMASPLFSTLIAGLAKKGLADGLADLYNGIIGWLLKHLGIESNFCLGEENSLLLTYWLLVAVIYVSGCVVKWFKAAEKKPEFREKNYSEKRAAFCQTLRQRIERINRETDWNESTFTPLDAEIEACFNKKRKKKFDDLLKCLKAYRRRNTVFLVLGDPGAGKSVAMRKLCLDLLDDSKNTGLVPVYIDLKKWNEPWDMNHLPTKSDLLKFILFILKENGDFSADDFVDVYFEKMFDNGRWYFIFDSFDELPCLMGRKYYKELIDELSDLLYSFLTGPNQRGGIISSRLFRSPSDTLRPTVTMTIQPFNDIKIKTMLKRYSSSTADTDKKLFGQREDLATLCRNPFYLSLLINYYKQNGMKLPANQMELYRSFVDSRLSRCSGKIEQEGLTVAQIRKAATDLAIYMEESPTYGLECPVNALLCRDDGRDWNKILSLLSYAKICRFGGANETVSFVHRRFQEFFHVDQILSRQGSITPDSYESILHNNGTRDALVLYCEIAEEDRVKEIAEYCWEVVKTRIDSCESIHNLSCVELVNTLYFMAEAFRNRREVMTGFLGEFQKTVQENLSEKADFLVQLALANSMILFDQDQVQNVVLRIFKIRNRWLSDIVMLNCRTMRSKLTGEVESRIYRYLGKVDVRTFFSRYRNVDFSLSLSREFRYLRFMHALQMLTFVTTITGICILLSGLLDSTLLFLRFWLDGTAGSLESMFVININAALFNIITFLTFLTFLNRNITIVVSTHVFVMTVPFAFSIYMLVNGVGVTVSIIALIWLLVNAAYCLIPVAHTVFRNEEKRPELLAKALLMLVFEVLLLMQRKLEVILLAVEPYLNMLLAIFTLLVLLPLLVLELKRGRSLKEILLNILRDLKYLVLTPVRFIRDGFWVRNLPKLDKLNRADLANHLLKHKTKRYRRAYVDHLIQNKVRLEGMWPDQIRPRFEDDELTYKLMKLDCAYMGNLRKPF